MKTYANYIFDLDGTLINSRQGILDSLTRAIVGTMPGCVLNLSGVRIGDSTLDIIRKCAPGISDLDMHRVRDAFREDYDTAGCQQGELYEGVFDTLSSLYNAGKTLYVCTKKPIAPSHRMLARTKILNMFTRVFCPDSSDTLSGASKPAMLRHLLRVCDIQPATALYIGDREEDAAAALENGVDFAWASYGYGNKIERLGDLL